jgi:MoaA/NifB/PqqE/SkfB family radical SAM enzyme
MVVAAPVSVARDFIDYPYFSDLGAVQLAAVLDEAALGPVDLVDAFALADSGLTWRDDDRAHLGAPLASVLAAMPTRDVTAIVVAYTPFHRPPHRDDVLAALLEGLRARFGDTPIVLADCYQSGQHYVEAPGPAVLAAYPEIDAWVKYEAEVTVVDLLRAWVERGERPAGTHRGAQADLAALPFPAWDRVDLAAHAAFRARVVTDLGRGQWAFPIDGPMLPVVTSRGCPFSCVHCSSNPDRRPGEPKTQRRLDATRLAAYLHHLRHDLGVERLAILDELVNVNERHFEALLAVLAREDFRFEIPNGMRADYLRREHLQAMRDRITTVSVSAESGSARVVADVVGKKLDLRHIVEAAEAAHAVGVPLLVHFMIGLPGETAQEVNETLAFALMLWDEYQAWPAVQFATPLPGTRLAHGRSLPVVDDWGPRFQKAPTADTGLDAAHLGRAMDTFQRRLSASRGPRKLVMNVTYACNNHCTFCAVGTRTQLDGHPPRQKEHLDRYRATGVEMVDFDGGEPTLNPQLIGLIRYARRIGYRRINVTTNGRMCTYESYAGKLVNSGLTTLLFSVHGPDARTHAQQVGVAEAFEQTIDGIRNCHRLKPASVELGINVTVTKGNHDKLDAIAQLAWSEKIAWLNIQFLTPFGRATHHVSPDTQVAAEHAMRLIDRWRDRMKVQIINLPFCFMPGYEAHMEGDLLKLERHMVFVNNETVNLAAYLAERRIRKPVCATCPHACFCGGFYELDDVPEPPWLIAAEDLVRPLDDPRRHESVPAGFHGRVAARLSPSDDAG